MRIFFILLTIVSCILIDLGSKYYFENSFTRDYCIYQESKNFSQWPWLGWISPSLLCSPEYWNSEIFNYYKDTARLPLVWDIVSLQLAYNRWVAFSLPINGIILQVITLLIIIGIIVSYVRTEYPKKDTLLDIGYSLILAGALSHGYERILNGYVVDFISVKYFAILNFADIFISIGACIIFFIYYVRR